MELIYTNWGTLSGHRVVSMAVTNLEPCPEVSDFSRGIIDGVQSFFGHYPCDEISFCRRETESTELRMACQRVKRSEFARLLKKVMPPGDLRHAEYDRSEHAIYVVGVITREWRHSRRNDA